MLSECPHCQHSLKLGEKQLAKIKKALAGLQPGKYLKLGCPHCKKAIELASDGSLAGAESPAFPAVALPSEPVVAAVRKTEGPPLPPEAPNMDWLKSGEVKEQEMLGDVTQVLILMAAGEARDRIFQAFDSIGYKAVYSESAEDAIGRMRFVSFSAVVLHATYEGSLVESSFHEHMRAMLMSKRRFIYYVLVGPDFRSLYDLEALTNSANLVVNDKDVGQFDLILKKGMHDYDDLFGLYLEMLEG